MADASRMNHLRWDPVREHDYADSHQHATLTSAGERIYRGWYEKGDSYFLPVARPRFDRVDQIWRKKDGRYRVQYYWRYEPLTTGLTFIDGQPQASSILIVKREGKWTLERANEFRPGAPHMLELHRRRPQRPERMKVRGCNRRQALMHLRARR
jgi:hypothetical protein